VIWVKLEAEVQQVAWSVPYCLHPLVSYMMVESGDVTAVPNEKLEAVDTNSGTGNHVMLM